MPRWLLIVIAILIVAGAAVALVLQLSGTRPGEVVRILSEGPIVELREEMRPPRGHGARVIVFALDGVGAAEFREAVASGAMAHVAALMGAATDDDGGFERGYAPDSVWSILPSTTYAAWTAVYTGEPVAASGVAGNEWFDRETMAFVAPAPVSVHEYADAVAVYADSLMHRWVAVPTVFELADVRSYVTLAAQYRGADLLVRPDGGMFGDLMSSFAAGVADGDTDWDTYSTLDESALESTLDAIEEFGLADLHVIYFPGVDLYTHVAEPALPEQHRYLAEVVDPAVGRILEAYRASGGMDSTYVFFVSDHGHTPALDTERHALGAGDDGETRDALEAAGFRVRPFELETDADDFQAVLAYQGAFAYVHLADRSTCPDPGLPCDWRRAPRFEEDVMAAVQAFDAANREGTAAAKLHGAIDMIFAREARGVEPAAPFQVWDGERLVPVAEYLTANPRPDLVDLERRLEQLGAGRYGHRAGDILLLSRYRMIDPIEERFYFSAKYRSWHGSPSRQDSEILFALAHPTETGERLRQRVRDALGEQPSQLDATPLILSLLAP
jgi:hypothetical protein